MKNIFKEGDKVFDIQYGWGIVKRIDFDANYPIFCLFDKYKQCYSIDGKIISGAISTLSFTEYTLEGFSQEREPKKGQPVWVRDSSADSWLISQFISYSPLSSYPYAVSDDMRIESRMNFKFMTTENPYTNEK